MPTICKFRGIKIYINWDDHNPPHFHASYAGEDVIVSIKDLEVMDGRSQASTLKCCLVGQHFIKRS